MKPLLSLWWIIVLSELVAIHFYGGVLLHHFLQPVFSMPSDLSCFWSNGALIRKVPGVTAGSVRNICAFMYPPPFLLIAVALSWLKPLPTYLLWVIATNAALVAAARLCQISWKAIAVALVSPANVYCVAVGQTGELTSAFLLLALGLANRRPAAAGIFAGALIIKPQFALLAPICFLAARNFRALGAMALTMATLSVAAFGLFGPSAWENFFRYGTVAAQGVLDQNWPQPFQGVMITWFIMLRSIGGSLGLAYLIQAVASALAFTAAWMIWSRPANGTARMARLAITMCLVTLATPYAYLYDLPGLAMAIAGLVAARRWENLFPLAIFTVFTGFCIIFSMLGIAMGAAFLFALVVSLWPTLKTRAPWLAEIA